jgi:polar amino acid transport system substrate-binding protein
MLLAACGIPRDVDDTMERARGGTIRVGVVVDTPWVTDSAGAVGGIEAALVNEIARGVNARPRWVRGSESALMEALRERELDLVIGGLTAKVPWSKEVAFTRPYYIDTLMLGAPPGTTVPDELRHTPVWVKEGAGAAGFVQKRGGVPRPVGDLHRAGGGNDLVAAPAWQLASLRRVPAGKPLNQQPRVLAAAPGENGWLMHVDTVLKNRKDRIPALLRGVWP